MNNYKQPGELRDWINGSGAAVVSGEVVVVGEQLGIATVDIASTETGTVSFVGVFEVPKVSAGVIADGERVMYDASAAAFDDNAASPATGDVTAAAVAVGPAIATAVTMLIQLNNRIGTVA
jgi:predicted RecA/RadA family phage recombinase